MNFSVSIPSSLNSFLDCLKGSGRHNLFAAAGNAVRVLVRSHLASESTVRHSSASRLGAQPTGHLAKAARATVFTADSTGATVTIPGAGISRAFHDLHIRATRAKFLTIPLAAFSYGRRVAEVRSLGYQIFRAKNVLMGKRAGETIPLYALKKSVVQRQDRSLLPSDEEISRTASRAMLAELERIKAAA